MKYLSENGLKHLIGKIVARFTQLESSVASTEITTAEIDTLWEEAV